MAKPARSLDAILKQKLSKYRLAVVGAVQADPQKQPKDALSPELFEQLLDAMSADYAAVKKEAANIRAALTTGIAPKTPNTSTPETQLAWGMALGFFTKYGQALVQQWDPAARPKKSMSEVRFWQQLKESRFIRREMYRNASYMQGALSNPDAKIRWGLPTSWFYYTPEGNLINIDLMYSLIGGFEHTRSITFHEIGHSQLTLKFPDEMDALISEIKEMKEKALKLPGGKKRKKARYTKAEYIKLSKLNAKYKLMHQLFNPAEDNCVNRFAVNMSKWMPQDYGFSLNHISATMAGTGRIATNGGLDGVKGTSIDDHKNDQKGIGEIGKKPDEKKQEAQEPGQIPEDIKKADREYRMLCHAVNMSFFQNNGLFPDTEQGWRKLGVDRDVIRSLFRFSPKLDREYPIRPEGKDANGNFDAFAYLRLLCSGQEGMEHLQPTALDRRYGAQHYKVKAEEYSAERNYNWEEMLERFGRPLVDKLLKFQMEQLQQQMDQKQEQNDGDGEGQESDTEIIDEDNPDQDGSGDGDGEGQKGDKSDAQPGQGGSGGEPGDDDDTVDVDGVGEMPDIDTPEDAPGDESGKGNDNDADADNDADGASAGDDNDDEGQSIDDIMKDADDLADDMDEGDDADADGQDADGQDGQDGPQKKGKPGQSGDGSGQAGEGGGVDSLDKLPVGDWSNYAAMVARYAGSIQKTTKWLEKIKVMQQQQVSRRSHQSHSLMPKDGELDRFSGKRQIDLKRKQAMGQQLDVDDFSRFEDDRQTAEPTEIDLVLLIDGSGSMNTSLKSGSYNDNSGPTRLAAAIHSACILYEAARKVGINVHIAAWGPENPIWLAKPGDRHHEIGQAIEQVKRGLNSGTSLRPALDSTVERLANQRQKKPFVGFSHVVILSDGDVGDREPTREGLMKMLQGVPKVTCDVAVLTKPGQTSETAITAVAKSVQTSRKEQDIVTVHEIRPDKIATSLLQLVYQKLRRSMRLAATAQQNKRRSLKRTAARMGLKK